MSTGSLGGTDADFQGWTPTGSPCLGINRFAVPRRGSKSRNRDIVFHVGCYDGADNDAPFAPAVWVLFTRRVFEAFLVVAFMSERWGVGQSSQRCDICVVSHQGEKKLYHYRR